MRGRVALAVLLLTISLIASGQEHDNVSLGFSANRVYQFGDLDNVNVFNGNLVIKVPIGLQYSVDEQTSLQLGLTYNSKVWDYKYELDGAYGDGQDHERAYPNFRSNAGLGWRLSLGRLLPPSNASSTPSNDPQNPHAWQYEGPSGDEHDFWTDLHGGGALDAMANPPIGYTHDSTYLRLRLAGSTIAYLDFPDGSTHAFTLLNGQWLLTTITGPLGGSITIAYSFTLSSPAAVTQWTMTDSTGGRTHYVHFKSSTMSSTDERGQIVDWIDLAAPPDPATGSARRAVYQFNYSQTAVPRGCGWAFHIDPTHTESLTLSLPMLSGVSLPDGSSWGFAYSAGVGSNCDQGALNQLTLPTGGTYAYTYTRWVYPSAAICGLEPTVDMTPGVTTRSVGGGTWKYVHSYAQPTIANSGFCMNNQPEGGGPEPTNQPSHWIRTAVLTPDGARTDHYFYGWNMAASDPYGGSREEYAQPFTRARWNSAGTAEAASDDGASPVRYLSTEVFTGCGDIDGNGNCTSVPSLARTTFLRYERDSNPNVLTQARVASERTRFDDDCNPAPCRYADVNRSDFDDLGHYRTETTNGNFAGSNFYSTFTNTNPGGAPAGGWNLGTFTEKSIGDGMNTFRTLTTFDPVSGFLQQRRVVAGSAPGATDLVSTFTRSTSGNTATIQEQDSGGDVATVYRTDFTYTAGVLTKVVDVDTTTNTPVPFFKIDRDVDGSTGLVLTARDSAGLPTLYKYDPSARIVQLAPPGLGITTFTYTNANGPTRAGVSAESTSSTDANEHVHASYEFDSLGRLARETRDMPAGTATRDTTYDAMSRPAARSEWEQGTPVHLTTFTYDAFGRIVTTTPPDGTSHQVRAQYTGVRAVTRTLGNAASRPLGGVAVGSDSFGNPVEDPAVKSETYDRLGRLVTISEQSGPANTAMTTYYAYDGAGRLSVVSSGVQGRTFAYDHRGFLLSESHPETSVTYENYDARGHATRSTSGPLALAYTFDAAGRIVSTVDRNTSQPMTAFTYGSANDCSTLPCDYRKGKLVTAVRHNYDDAGIDQPVTESYLYAGLGGRVSRRDTTVRLLSGTDQKFRLQQTWDGAGRPASLTYPARCLDLNCNASTSPRTVSVHYGAGLITSVDGYAPSVSYQPNGLLATLVHSNGVSDSWSADGSGMPRPADISITGANLQPLEIGPYAYDADGNLTRIGAVQYRYDKVSRLVSAAGPVSNSTWAYDAYGNMIAYGGGTFSGNVFGAYTVPLPIDAATNRLHDPSAITPPDDVATYDGAGNMTQASYPASAGGRFDYRYTWDALGAMRTLRAGDRPLLDAGADGLVKQRYLYTVDGERIGVLGTAPGGQPKSSWTLRGLDAALLSTFVEQSGSWSWKEDQIWRGTALLANESPTGTQHYHLDHLGSPRVVTNASGTLVGQQDFTPFGAGGTTDGGALQFTAHERDRLQTATGSYLEALDYMHARYYSPAMGRFLSVDPKAHVRQAMRRPQMWNRYAYAINNPMVYTDPTGESVFLVTYTTGNVNSDEELRRAAYTRAIAIRNQKGFDPRKDTVLVRGVGSVADFGKAVEEANGLGSKFGGMHELSLFSHSGRYDGPIFHDARGNEQNLDWRTLDFNVNWESGGSARFYGCTTAASGFAKAFAHAQSVPAYGFGHHTYFSSDPNERVGVREGGPLYMIDALGNSDLPILGGLAAIFGNPDARPMIQEGPDN
jgi:RHS repeat-associated protein